MGRRLLGAVLAVVTVLLAGCANIPEQSTPQAVGNVAQQPGAPAAPEAGLDPLTLVRRFVDLGGSPETAKGYLTPAAQQKWPGDVTPTIIGETYGTGPIPAQELKAQGDDGQGNEVTVVLSVTRLGRLDTVKSFAPIVDHKQFEYLVVVRRDNADAPWRIQTPPEDTVLIPLSKFNESYMRVNAYFFDPAYRVTVPDLRYIPAQPVDGRPDRVMRALLDGPSTSLADAAVSALPLGAEMRTNAVLDADGALVVNLTKLGDRTREERNFIAAQVVLTLQEVVKTKIRLLADSQPLINGHADWRAPDVPAYDGQTRPNAELTGLFTDPSGKVHSLRDGNPIQGPAGSGEIAVRSAAQSIEGKSLAVVREVPAGVRLMVGGIGPGVALREVDLPATSLTRPTWLLGGPGGNANEVWTVQNGTVVVRVVRGGNDNWAPSPVLSQELTRFGTITELRLSRDGVRVLAVISGRVVVASVVRTNNTVAIRAPRELRPGELTTVVGADWLNQETIVVATGQSGQPVVNVPVNGFEVNPYNSSNLGPPITSIAAAPDRAVLVTDSRGTWQATEVREIWKLNSTPPAGAQPFYPG